MNASTGLNMLDIAIVHVPYMFNTNPPMAGALLKSCLAKQGLTAKVVDLNLDFLASNLCNDNLISYFQKPDTRISRQAHAEWLAWIRSQARSILDIGARWIGISVFTKDSQIATEDLALALKELDPDCKILIGGLGSNVLRGQFKVPWYELAYQSDLVDSVIVGEGENAIIDVVKNDLRGIMHATQLTSKELDDVPLPDFSDYDLSRYQSDMTDDSMAIPITASKGCVRDCTFCDVGKHWSQFRWRSGAKVAHEMMQLYHMHGYRNFRFTDSLLNGNVKEFRCMNDVLAKELPQTLRYRGQFICRGRSQMPLSDFKAMADAGAYRVQIGIESGSEAVREHMRKKFNNADIDYTANALADNGIRQSWYMFVGYPTETDHDFKASIDLIQQHKNLWGLQIIPTGVFQLLDGTPLASDDMMHELGITRNNLNGYETYAWTSTAYPSNTFEIRADRFKILVELCRQYDLIQGFEDMVDGHMKMISDQENHHRGG